MKTLSKTILATAFAAITASSANAAIVTQWTVAVDAQFVPGSIVATDGAPGGVVISNSNKTLRWGTDIGNGQSGLDISNSPTSATVTTGINTLLPAVANISITHQNQPIQAPSLDRVSLTSQLTLTPSVPALPGLPSQTLAFLIDFLETPNDGGIGGACAGGGTSGVGALNGNGCADIFVMNQDALNFSFFYDTDGAGGDAAQEYFISFLELTSGLNPLPSVACESVLGAGNTSCLGFLTPEVENTAVQFGSIITTQRVEINPLAIPEPGSMGLFGLALAALGFSLRRKAPTNPLA